MESICAQDLSVFDSNGVSPLHIACELAHADLVRLLLLCGASPSLPCSASHVTPLAVACSRGAAEVVQILLDAGADANATHPPQHDTPLMIACACGFAQLVPLLCQHGADVSRVRDADGATAFSLACQQQRQDALKALLTAWPTKGVMDTPADTDALLEMLQAACAAPLATDWVAVRMLLQRVDLSAPQVGNAFDEPTNTVFVLRSWLQQLLPAAISNGDHELLRLLLERHQRDPNLFGSAHEAPLLLATRKHDAEAVWLLLKHGADPNLPLPADEVFSPLWPVQLAAEQGTVALLLLLLTHPTAPSLECSMKFTARRTALLQAAMARDRRRAHLVLAAGASHYVLPPPQKEKSKVSSKVVVHDKHLRTERDLSGLALNESHVVKLLTRDHPDLVSLNLDHNALLRLDFALMPHRFQSLHTLRLASNSLQAPPSGLARLSSLTHLDLSANAITSLQALVDDADGPPLQLRHLLLRENPLTWLPLQLHMLTSLRQLDIDTGKLVGAALPEPVLRLPTPELLAYLRALVGKSLRWNHAKVVFLGEENVGKTTIVKFLHKGTVAAGASHTNISTDGIHVSGMLVINMW